MGFKSYLNTNILSEAKMLDISIKAAHKVLTKEDKIKEFLNADVKIEEKLDGIKVTCMKIANKGELSDWIIAYKGDILYDEEFDYLSDSDIKKHSIASAQFKFVIEHFKKIAKNTRGIPTGTELFVEFLMKKPTLSSNYTHSHGMVLIGHSKSKHRIKGNKLFTQPMGFFVDKRNKYADIMKLDVPNLMFKGKLNTKKNILKGILEPKMKELFNKVESGFNWDVPELLVDDLRRLLIKIDSFYGGEMEGVVCEYNGQIIKFQKEGQVDKEARDKIKMRYKEDDQDNENLFWDNVRASALEIIQDLDKSKPMIQLVKEITKKLKNYKLTFSHSKKNKAQIIDDIQGNCKMILTKHLVGQNGSLISGRFQPFTLGHKKMFDEAFRTTDYVVVNLVKGKKSDAAKNPYDAEFQKQMIQATFPDKEIEFIESMTGSLITIMNKAEQNINVVWCGSDRYEEYKKQVSRNPDITVKEIKRTDNDISATQVRDALKNDDFELFKTLVPPQLHKFYDKLKEGLK